MTQDDDRAAVENAPGPEDKEPAENEVTRLINEQNPGVDWFLAYLVGFADAYRIGLGVTLTVGGATISGVLISGREYFRLVGEGTRGGNVHGAEDKANDLREAMAQHMEQWADIYPDPGQGDLSPMNARPNYIHLQDARFIVGEDAVPGGKGTLWRGKVAEVSGFVVGQLGA